MMRRLVFRAGVFFSLALILCACSSSEDRALAQYLHRITSQKPKHVASLTTPFSFEKPPIQTTLARRNPFLPVVLPPIAPSPIEANGVSAQNNGLHSKLIRVRYAKAQDIARLIQEKERGFLSSKGVMVVDARTNAIWVQDESASLGKLYELIQQLDIPVRQVQIEARIVDMTKDCALDLGVQFGVSNATHLSGTLRGANQMLSANGAVHALPLADRLNVDMAAHPLVGNPASIGLALAKLGDGILLDLELSALESEGRAEVISSPKVITTNQQTAVIEAGEDIPYQEATASGATAVAFRKAVLSLQVTPQITPDNLILMDLKISQDMVSPRNYHGTPAILTKDIHTQVLAKNGQTIVLGGIYKRDKNNVVTRVPFLGGLPIVGALFRRTSVSVTNEELLVFITPKIVNGESGGN